jgi:hypothetical protein
MRLREYLEAAGHGEISRLVRTAGVAGSTIHDVLNGKPIKKYETAKRISDATGGRVTVAELCEPEKSAEPAA